MKNVVLILTIAALLTGGAHAVTNAVPSQITKAQIVEALTRVLNDKDPRIRAEAVSTLGALRLKEFVPALIKLLDDDEPGVRRAAVKALGDLEDRSATPYLLSQLATAFAATSTNEAGLVISSGKSSLPDVFWLRTVEQQTKSIRAIGELRDPTPVDLLVERGLTSPNISVCIVTAVALGKIKDKRASKPLQEILREYYRKPELDTDGGIQDPKTQAVLQELAAKNAYYRAAICWALGEIGDVSALDTLQLAKDDNNSLVYDAAVEAVDKLSRLKQR